MKNKITLFILLTGFVTSCKKEKIVNDPADELVFGTHYGFCQGDCFTVFGIDSQEVQQDTGAHYLYNYQNYTFNGTVTLHDSLFAQVSHLLNEIPAELTTSDDKVFGCPDCHDQGGVYVEINSGDVKKRFDIDNDSTGDQSQEIIDFKRKVIAAVDLLK